MNIIDKYQFGRIIINGLSYHNDIIIFPDYLQQNWWREEGHLLKINDLTSIIDYQPDTLIIGTGMFGLMKIEYALVEKLKDLKIKNIMVEKTMRACELFNKETSPRKTAALHLTC